MNEYIENKMNCFKKKGMNEYVTFNDPLIPLLFFTISSFFLLYSLLFFLLYETIFILIISNEFLIIAIDIIRINKENIQFHF